MQRLHAIPVLLLAWAWPAVGAEKLPPLDAEFLEFLASFDSDEEDWALFVDEEEPPPAKEPGAKPDGTKQEAAAKPAEKR
jgi:hypothetical protein